VFQGFIFAPFPTPAGPGRFPQCFCAQSLHESKQRGFWAAAGLGADVDGLVVAVPESEFETFSDAGFPIVLAAMNASGPRALDRFFPVLHGAVKAKKDFPRGFAEHKLVVVAGVQLGRHVASGSKPHGQFQIPQEFLVSANDSGRQKNKHDILLRKGGGALAFLGHPSLIKSRRIYR
tara:strand:- start:641 stop:1171 length:531 start_codon:yes stop_codon:yes gene_type:complete